MLSEYRNIQTIERPLSSTDPHECARRTLFTLQSLLHTAGDNVPAAMSWWNPELFTPGSSPGGTTEMLLSEQLNELPC